MYFAIIAFFVFLSLVLYRSQNGGALLLWFFYWFKSTYRFGCNLCTRG